MAMFDPTRASTSIEDDETVSYHIDSLKQAFKQFRRVDNGQSSGSRPAAPGGGDTGGAGSGRSYMIEQSEAEFQVWSQSPYAASQLADVQTPLCKTHLNLYLSLGPLFPEEAPVFTTFGGTKLNVLWEPKKSLLSEAALAAFLYLRQLWGLLKPPTLGNGDVPAIPHFSDDVIGDLLHNDHAFKSYVYQLPYAKEIRNTEKSTLDLLENLSAKSEANSGNLSRLQSEVKELEASYAANKEELEQAKKDAEAFIAYSTPEGLLKALADEAHTEDVKSQMLADQFLHPVAAMFSAASDNGSIGSISTGLNSAQGAGAADDDDTLESFYNSRVAFHQLELKRRAYASDTQIIS